MAALLNRLNEREMRHESMEMGLEERKIALIFRLFVDLADQDYLAARSAYADGLFHVFYWCAAQGCEKYMKALLLFQDASSKGYGHDLERLFEDVRRYDGNGIIPDTLALPKTSAMGGDQFQGRTLAEFVRNLSFFGSPDSRYGVEGTNVDGPLLHALDILFHALRRLMRVTNFIGGDLYERQSIGLVSSGQGPVAPDWMLDPLRLLEMLFVERYQVGTTPRLRFVFRNMNFAFF